MPCLNISLSRNQKTELEVELEGHTEHLRQIKCIRFSLIHVELDHQMVTSVLQFSALRYALLHSGKNLVNV